MLKYSTPMELHLCIRLSVSEGFLLGVAVVVGSGQNLWECAESSAEHASTTILPKCSMSWQQCVRGYGIMSEFDHAVRVPQASGP